MGCINTTDFIYKDLATTGGGEQNIKIFTAIDFSRWYSGPHSTQVPESVMLPEVASSLPVAVQSRENS